MGQQVALPEKNAPAFDSKLRSSITPTTNVDAVSSISTSVVPNETSSTTNKKNKDANSPIGPHLSVPNLRNQPKFGAPSFTNTRRSYSGINNSHTSHYSDVDPDEEEDTNTDKQLTVSTMNQNVRHCRYAVRGELVIRADEHRLTLEAFKQNKAAAGADGDKLKSPLPFEEIVFCNIGNPQALAQPPITLYRQVLALIEYQQMLLHPLIDRVFPKDAIERASSILATFPGTGAYSHPQGLPVVRKVVAEFIEKRDGYPSDPTKIFLADGASPAIKHALRVLIRNRKDGIMVPTPQYPLYSASIAMFNGRQLDYYLDEDNGWALEVEELERCYADANSRGILPRGLVIINPGNPTGQSLTEKNIRDIIDFCKRRKLVILADEVYQDNIYFPETKPFISFKKVLCSMGSEYDNVELFSFHSTSKGFLGECGKRGGYMELHNIDEKIRAQFYKLTSIDVCSNVVGQVMLAQLVDPPKPGDDSYEQFHQEKDMIHQSLRRRAVKLVDTLNQLEGVSCTAPEASMFAFPTIRLPKKAIDAATAKGKKPDTFYCLELLDNTGICVVPGSGFGQKKGTWHFRTTFLPPEDKMDMVIEKIASFHKSFMDKYRD